MPVALHVLPQSLLLIFQCLQAVIHLWLCSWARDTIGKGTPSRTVSIPVLFCASIHVGWAQNHFWLMLNLPNIEAEVQPVHSSAGKWQFTEVLSWAYELLLIALQWWISTQPTPPSSLQVREYSREAMAKGTIQGKKRTDLQGSEQRQIAAAGNEGFHPHLLCSSQLYWCEPAQIRWASTCEWLHTRIVKAGLCGQLAVEALRGVGAGTWELRPCLSPQERGGNSTVSPQSENVLDSCKCCHTVSECLQSNFLPAPNLHTPR